MGDVMDQRAWVESGLGNERLTMGCPVDGVQILSARQSTRCWTEVHSTVTLAAIARNQPAVEARWRTRCRALSATAGSLMAIEPGDVHVTESVSAPSAFDAVKLSPALLEEGMQALGFRGAFHFRSPTVVNPRVFDALGELVTAYAGAAQAFELETATAELVFTVVDEVADVPHGSGIALDPVRDYRLRRARDYLHSQPERKPSLDELSGEVGLSKFRLCALFKESYGLSVGQYWAARRVTEAARLLLLGISIKEVTARLGFTDEAFFTRSFRKHRGCPPGAWVALHRKNQPRDTGGQSRFKELMRRAAQGSEEIRAVALAE